MTACAKQDAGFHVSIEDITQFERILQTIRKCGNGVRWKASVQHFEIDTLRWASAIRRQMRDGTFQSKGFCHFDLVERGTLRHIQSVHISERTVQKLLCNYALKPVILPRLIYDNSASQEGKGTDFALKRLKEHLRWHYARHGNNGYIMVMDYHHFFDSMPHDMVIEALADQQTDPIIRKYIADFVNAFDGEYGLGLGSEISQIAAIYYPNAVDKLIKEKYHIHCYARYMDDSYLIHPDRKVLEQILDDLKRFAAKYHIEFHGKKTKIHNLKSDGFVFLKKRVRLTDTGKIVIRVSRENIAASERKIRSLREEVDAGRMSLSSAVQSYQSRRGYAKAYDSYVVVKNYDRLFGRLFHEQIADGKIRWIKGKGYMTTGLAETKTIPEDMTDEDIWTFSGSRKRVEAAA